MAERDEVREWHLLEQDSLHRASDEEFNKPSIGDVENFTKLADASGQMKQKYVEVKESAWADFIGYVARAASYATSDAKTCQNFAKSGLMRKDCRVDSDTFDYVKLMDRYYSYIDFDDKPEPKTIECTHLVSKNVVNRDSIRLPALINDITACFHRSLEHYEDKTRKWHKEGKCMWRE